MSQISSRDLTLSSSLDIPTTFYRFAYDDAVLLGLNAAGVAAVGSTLIGNRFITKTSLSLTPRSIRSSEGSLFHTDLQLSTTSLVASIIDFKNTINPPLINLPITISTKSPDMKTALERMTIRVLISLGKQPQTRRQLRELIRQSHDGKRLS